MRTVTAIAVLVLTATLPMCFLPELQKSTGESTDTDCFDCAASECGTRFEACFSSSACTELLECALACEEDAACVQACGLASPEGIGDVLLLADCTDVHCSAECPSLTDMTGTGGAGGGNGGQGGVGGIGGAGGSGG